MKKVIVGVVVLSAVAACRSTSKTVTPTPATTTMVGAGTGATIGKIGTPDRKAASGLGTATERDGDVIVSALMVVNAAGYLRGPADAPARWETPELQPLENTTIGVS